MLMRDTICNKCGHNYDPVNTNCPKCDEINPNPEAHKKQRGLIWLPRWQEIAFFLTGWLGLNIIGIIIQLALSFLNSESTKIMYMAVSQFVTYGLLFIGMIFLAFQNHRKILASFKSVVPYAIGIGIGVGILLLGSFYKYIASLFVDFGVNGNEDLVRKITISYPALSILIFAFVGPICEELTYRIGLFSFFARIGKWLAYLVTIAFFALIHFDFLAGSPEAYLVELLNLPSYLIAGGLLCFAYDYFGLAASLTAHVTNNLVAVVSILISNIISQ